MTHAATVEAVNIVKPSQGYTYTVGLSRITVYGSHHTKVARNYQIRAPWERRITIGSDGEREFDQRPTMRIKPIRNWQSFADETRRTDRSHSSFLSWWRNNVH